MDELPTNDKSEKQRVESLKRQSEEEVPNTSSDPSSSSKLVEPEKKIARSFSVEEVSKTNSEKTQPESSTVNEEREKMQ